jgi:hypothetical protein
MTMEMQSSARVPVSSESLERCLSNDDDPTTCEISDSSTSSSIRSSDSISDDELPVQESGKHPLFVSQQDQQQPRSVNASARTFRKLHVRSDSGRIRSKLLSKLGIELNNTNVGNASTSTEVARVIQKGQDEAFHIPLKWDYGKIDRNLVRAKQSIETLATIPGNAKIEEKSSKHERVHFDASVKVHPIPARSDYSNRMRNVMWVSSSEIQQNAARNSLEFAAEEWDVSKVVNDEDMILYGGELIHPIHFIQQEQLTESSNVSEEQKE